MKNLKYILIIQATLFIFFTVKLQAQTTTSSSNGDKVVVIADYQPSLSDAHKINISPAITEKDIDKADLKYSISPRLYKTYFEPQKIVAARLSGEPLSKLYQSYIRGGFGNYTTPYAELFYNNLRSRTYNLGLNYKHYSSSGKIKNYGPAGFSDNILNVYGKQFSGSHIFTGNFMYKRNAFHYYGFEPEKENLVFNDSLKKATLQKYQIIEATAGAASNYSDKDKLHHAFDINFYTLKNVNTAENAFDFKAMAYKNINIITKIDDEKIKIDAGVNYYNNPEFSIMQNGAVYYVKPQLSFRMNQYALNVGFNTSIEASDDSYIHFFPIIEGQIGIAKDVLSLYGSFTGGIERNNVRALFEENPFIVTNLDSLHFTKNKVNFNGGIKGNIASVFSFNLGAGFKDVEGMPFFINDTAELFNKFNVIYDDVQVLTAHADISFQASEKFMLMLGGAYNHYTMGTEKHAWHKPQLKANIIAAYKLVDKINIKAEIYSQDKTYAKLFSTANDVLPHSIKPFVDGNLALEYIYNKKISAFLNLNNLGGTRYYRWYSYPSQRFHFLAGMTYAF